VIACLLQGVFQYAREPQRLQSLVDQVNAILKDEQLEPRYQELLEGLQEALKANRPLDPPLLRDLATHAGMELGELLGLAEEQAAPSWATHYAQELLKARLKEKIRALATQLWERHGIPPKRIDGYARLAQVLGVEPRELMQQGGLIWHTETDAPTPRMGYGRRGAIR
jgi:hypothetical protein